MWVLTNSSDIEMWLVPVVFGEAGHGDVSREHGGPLAEDVQEW